MPPRSRPPGNKGSRPGAAPTARPRVRIGAGAAKRGRDRMVRTRRATLIWLSRLGNSGRIALALLALVLVAGGMTALLGQERYHPVPAGPALTPMEEEADASAPDEPEDAGDEDAAETADLPSRPGPAPAVPEQPAAPPPPAAAPTTPAPGPSQVAALPAAPPRPLPPLVAPPAGTPAWKHFALPAPAATGQIGRAHV